MTGWEFDDLRQILDFARQGNTKLLSTWISNTPFVKANEDFTKLLVLRKFRAKSMDYLPNPIVFVAPPDSKDFQWGITIITTPDDGETDFNIYLPNEYAYTGLEFIYDEITILAKGMSKKTNIRELHQQLRQFRGNVPRAELKVVFDGLSNVKIAASVPKKTKVYKATVNSGQPKPTIDSKVLGTLTYSATHEWYESKKIEGHGFNICIDHEDAEEFPSVKKYAEKVMKNKFYEKHLLAMEPEMIQLKNDVWLDEDEAPVTPEIFRERISIDSIVFHSDQSCTIYCNDGELFGEHSIVISVDEEGNYDEATLAG